MSSFGGSKPSEDFRVTLLASPWKMHWVQGIVGPRVGHPWRPFTISSRVDGKMFQVKVLLSNLMTILNTRHTRGLSCEMIGMQCPGCEACIHFSGRVCEMAHVRTLITPVSMLQKDKFQMLGGEVKGSMGYCNSSEQDPFPPQVNVLWCRQKLGDNKVYMQPVGASF